MVAKQRKGNCESKTKLGRILSTRPWAEVRNKNETNNNTEDSLHLPDVNVLKIVILSICA